MTKRGSDFKRPEVLDADIHFFSNQGNKWVAIVGKIREEPYEIFTGPLITDNEEDGIFISPTAKSPQIKKKKLSNGTNTYELQYLNNKGFKFTVEGLESIFESSYWNYSYMIAGMLRYEMKLPDIIRIVEGMYEDNETINSWKRGVLRVLRKYSNKKVKESTGSWLEKTEGETIDNLQPGIYSEPFQVEISTDSIGWFNPKGDYYAQSQSCPECNGNMRFEGGCQICNDCGYSACG